MGRVEAHGSEEGLLAWTALQLPGVDCSVWAHGARACPDLSLGMWVDKWLLSHSHGSTKWKHQQGIVGRA